MNSVEVKLLQINNRYTSLLHRLTLLEHAVENVMQLKDCRSQFESVRKDLRKIEFILQRSIDKEYLQAFFTQYINCFSSTYWQIAWDTRLFPWAQIALYNLNVFEQKLNFNG